MNQTEAAEILRDFENNRQIAESGEDRRWKWTPGTLLFPEGRCCYCGEAVRSNRIWSVDAVGEGRLNGQLNINKGETAEFERPEHPHAGTDGSLCTGGHDVLTALFFGINPADLLRRGMDVKRWYSEMFDHVCGTAGLKAADGLFADRTALRADRNRDRECGCGCGCTVDGGSCSCCDGECECSSFVCAACEDSFSVEDDRTTGPDEQYYCWPCYDARWRQCSWCELVMTVESGAAARDAGEWYCPDHVLRENRQRVPLGGGLTVEPAVPPPAAFVTPLTAAIAEGAAYWERLSRIAVMDDIETPAVEPLLPTEQRDIDF